MDKNEVIDKYKSHPDVQKVLNMIVKDKNWVYDLFDLVKQVVFDYFENSNLQIDKRIDELRKNIVIQVFGIFLIKIAKAKKTDFLFNFLPMNDGDLEKFNDPNNKEQLVFMIPLDPRDWRPLNSQLIVKAVNEYLIIAESFFTFINNDRKAAIDKIPELFEIFSKRTDKEKDLLNLIASSKTVGLNQSQFINTKSSVIAKNKPNSGRKPTYKSKSELLTAISKIPRTEYNSKVKLAKLLGMSEGNLRRLLKEFEIDFQFN